MKVVINKCFGGFNLSDRAFRWLIKNRGWKVGQELEINPKSWKMPKKYRVGETKKWKHEDDPDFRSDPDVVAVVESLGDKAAGPYALLKIVHVPNNICWEIDDYDGAESIEEKHRTWG